MTRGTQLGRIDGPPTFRPAHRLAPVASHRPSLAVEHRDAKVVPMWLRELRRDRREFIV